jgi:hypothetical protein
MALLAFPGELEPGHPAQRGRSRRQVPKLRHHAEVVAHRDVLGAQALAEPENVAMPDRERAAGGRSGALRPALAERDQAARPAGPG